MTVRDKRFVLAVDLDGVAADYLTAIRTVAGEWSGRTDLCADPDYTFSKWGIDSWPGGYPALHRFAVTRRGLFEKMLPMPNAPQVLRRLSAADVRIRIVTARLCIKYHHAEAVRQTVDWLEQYSVPYWDLCFVADKTTIDADLFVDDSDRNVRSLWDAGKAAVIFTNSTNVGVPGPRVDNWLELEKHVMKMARQPDKERANAIH